MSRRRKLAYLVAKQRGICYLCGGPLKKPTVDHKYPKSKGGSSAMKNLKAACARCNWEKAAMTIGQYRKFKSEETAA